jgi:hypothetical protein
VGSRRSRRPLRQLSNYLSEISVVSKRKIEHACALSFHFYFVVFLFNLINDLNQLFSGGGGYYCCCIRSYKVSLNVFISCTYSCYLRLENRSGKLTLYFRRGSLCNMSLLSRGFGNNNRFLNY